VEILSSVVLSCKKWLGALLDTHLGYAPALLISVSPLLADTGENDQRSFHPIFLELLDRYIDVPDISSALNDSLHWKTWIGDTSSYWDQLLPPLEELSNHSSWKVRKWAAESVVYVKWMLEKDLGKEAEQRMR